MARIKRGKTSHAKHKKLREQTKGYMMTRRRLVRKAKEAVLHAGQYAFVGRKGKKRNFRRDWILHISEALKRSEGPHINYSSFMHKLKTANIQLDRKILAELATQHLSIFKQLVEKVK